MEDSTFFRQYRDEFIMLLVIVLLAIIGILILALLPATRQPLEYGLFESQKCYPGKNVFSIVFSYHLILTVGVSGLAFLCVTFPLSLFVVILLPNRIWHRLSYGASYLISSIPIFFVAAVLTQHFDLSPPNGYWYSWEAIPYYITPIILLGIGNGYWIEMVRHLKVEILKTLAADYMKALKTRGIVPAPGLVFNRLIHYPLYFLTGNFSEVKAEIYFIKHLGTNILAPILNVSIAQITSLLGAAIVVEYFFSYEGIALLSLEAAVKRDYPLIAGITISLALIVWLLAFIKTILLQKFNPRSSH